MRRITLYLSIAALLFLCASPAFAHTKSFDDYDAEFDNLISAFKDADTIYTACQSIMDAFEQNDQEAIAENYKVLIKAKLMPEHYRLKDTSLIVQFRDVYKELRDKYQEELKHNAECQGYWIGNSFKLKNMLLDKEKAVFPALNTKKYQGDIIAGLPTDFFNQNMDSNRYIGDIFLLVGSIYEYNEKGQYWVIHCSDSDERYIGAVNPVFYDKNLDYIDLSDTPAVGEEAYFYLTFTEHREGDTMVFYMGADDKIINIVRMFSTPNDPKLQAEE